jgi:hypothetical protein
VTLSSNGTLSQAEFSCSTGYHIAGDEIISCQTDGLWDGVDPLCGKHNIYEVINLINHLTSVLDLLSKLQMNNN